jgi:hypothetical protein
MSLLRSASLQRAPPRRSARARARGAARSERLRPAAAAGRGRAGRGAAACARRRRGALALAPLRVALRVAQRRGVLTLDLRRNLLHLPPPPRAAPSDARTPAPSAPCRMVWARRAGGVGARGGAGRIDAPLPPARPRALPRTAEAARRYATRCGASEPRRTVARAPVVPARGGVGRSGARAAQKILRQGRPGSAWRLRRGTTPTCEARRARQR